MLGIWDAIGCAIVWRCWTAHHVRYNSVIECQTRATMVSSATSPELRNTYIYLSQSAKLSTTLQGTLPFTWTISTTQSAWLVWGVQLRRFGIYLTRHIWLISREECPKSEHENCIALHWNKPHKTRSRRAIGARATAKTVTRNKISQKTRFVFILHIRLTGRRRQVESIL